MRFVDIFHNDILVCAFIAWVAAQVIKAIVFMIQNRRFDWERLFGDGGMPSAHSALVCAAATVCAVDYGFASAQFGIATVLALVVLHDASGIRLESGKQARTINMLVDVLKRSANVGNIQYLRELLGHTPLQVFFGSILGIGVSLLYCL